MSSFTYNILRANVNSFKETSTFNIAILPAEFIYVYVYYYNSNKNTLNIHLEVKLASLRDSTIRWITGSTRNFVVKTNIHKTMASYTNLN